MTMVHAATLLCAMAYGQADDEPRKLSVAEKERIIVLAVEIQQTEGGGRDAEGMVWLSTNQNSRSPRRRGS